MNRLAADHNHYTGQLTLEKVCDADWKSWTDETWLIDGRGYRPYYVVDGQQRLTTAIILIKCLLDCIPQNGQLAFSEKSDHVKQYLFQALEISRAFIFGYQRDNPSYEYFKTQVLGLPSIQYEGVETTYTANLLCARDFFRTKLQNATNDNLERWFKSLTQRFVFNVYELVEDLDVFVVFETMNNRGKKLSNLELLKNRLIYLSTLLPTADTERLALRKDINDAWKTVFEFLGREKGAPLDDDDFLWAHWAMYFTYTRDEAGALQKFLLTTYFTVQNVTTSEVTAAILQAYVASIQNSARRWYEIHFPHRATSLAENVRRGLEKLGRLGRGAFDPLIMAALQITNDEGEITDLLCAAERFIFVVNRLCRSRADTGDNEFYRLAHGLFTREKTISEAIQTINERTSRHFSKEKVITEMRELFRYEKGFYSWSGLQHFLFEYEQDLKEKAVRAEGKIDWNEFVRAKKDHVTIEHIYSQTANPDEWPSFAARNEKERLALLNSLGNLLALSQSRNSSFSNRAFVAKTQDANGVKGYYNGSYSEIAVAQLSDWTPEAVLKRGFEMMDFLERRWNISLGSTAEKKQFLFLEFISDPSSASASPPSTMGAQP